MMNDQQEYQPTPELLAIEALFRAARAISGIIAVAAHASLGTVAAVRSENAIKGAFDGLLLANMNDLNMSDTPEGKYLASAIARIQAESSAST